jgi:non-canonical (house-cleaning) NTP pyrophosphatase
LSEGKEISDIAVDMGFADNREFRQGLWMVWVLTKSRVTRIDYTYQAVQMALLHLENPEHY